MRVFEMRTHIDIYHQFQYNCISICVRALDVVVFIICVVIVRIIYIRLSCICIQEFIVNIDQAFSIEDL